MLNAILHLKIWIYKKKKKNHKLFEKWRNRNIKKLKKKEKENMLKDIKKSYNLYYEQFISSIDLNKCETSYMLLFKLIVNNFNNYLKELSSGNKNLKDLDLLQNKLTRKKLNRRKLTKKKKRKSKRKKRKSPRSLKVKP